MYFTGFIKVLHNIMLYRGKLKSCNKSVVHHRKR